MRSFLLITFLICLHLTQILAQKQHQLSTQPQNFPEADLVKINPEIGSNENSDQKQLQLIQNVKKGSGPSTRSIDSLFSKLPSSTTLDKLINDADSVALLKTVQTLASHDSIPCSQIVDYLLQMLGRIRTAMEKKQFHANQLEVIIVGAKAEIQRLEREIKILQNDREALQLNNLRQKLDQLVTVLEKYYQQFNSVQVDIAPNEAKVVGYRKEIEILNNNSDQQRERIIKNKLELTAVDVRINDLQNSLRQARIQRQNLVSSIARSEDAIIQNDKQVAKARKTIEEIEEDIDKIRDKADEIRKKFTQLEIQVERIRTQIAISEAKEIKILEEIAQFKDRIYVEEKKTAQNDLNSLLNMVRRLKKLIPGIQRQIDRQYYYCYGEGSIVVEQTGSVLVYIVRGQSFGNYILEAYGTEPQNAIATPDQLHRIDIFSASWITAFGYPFNEFAFASEDFSFAGDFSCLNPSSVVTGQGIIRDIDANTITAEYQGQLYTFKLGACTRLEARTLLPRKGQNFGFRAVPSFAGGYNLYSATCW